MISLICNIVSRGKSKVCVVAQTFRKSSFAIVSTILGPEEKNPLPNGLYATIPIPSSLNNQDSQEDEVRDFESLLFPKLLFTRKNVSPASRNYFFLHISGPQGPFQLDCCNWMNSMSPSDCCSRGLRETNVLYFTLFNQFLQLSHLVNGKK